MVWDPHPPGGADILEAPNKEIERKIGKPGSHPFFVQKSVLTISREKNKVWPFEPVIPPSISHPLEGPPSPELQWTPGPIT